ncbi:hypothetical protein DFH09DRAFT_1293039 [Mycena vulgaris]|nr:hypothetical protein DFH09DRAFT_1293039 [Mycena vulgaris]
MNQPVEPADSRPHTMCSTSGPRRVKKARMLRDEVMPSAMIVLAFALMLDFYLTGPKINLRIGSLGRRADALGASVAAAAAAEAQGQERRGQGCRMRTRERAVGAEYGGEGGGEHRLPVRHAIVVSGGERRQRRDGGGDGRGGNSGNHRRDERRGHRRAHGGDRRRGSNEGGGLGSVLAREDDLRPAGDLTQRRRTHLHVALEGIDGRGGLGGAEDGVGGQSPGAGSSPSWRTTREGCRRCGGGHRKWCRRGR